MNPSSAILTRAVDRKNASPSWYAAKVRTGSERAAEAELRRKGYSTFCPTTPEVRNYGDRKKTINNAIFPGYVFCKFDLRDRVKVVSSTAVSYIVGSGTIPIPVPESELEAIRRALEVGGWPVPYPRVGQPVRVSLGRLAGLEGLLVSEGTRDRLIVSVNMLLRSVAVHITRDQVVGKY